MLHLLFLLLKLAMSHQKTVFSESDSNTCMHCGACCAAYRVSFYWAEGESKKIPVQMTEQVNHFYSCMKGTNQRDPHCGALQGTVGQQVACSIYLQRPETCKEVTIGDEKCNKARARYGLPAIC
jgi:Fe-S-cluster containining protein